MSGVVYGTVTTDASLCPRTGATGWAVWIAATVQGETRRFQRSGIHPPGTKTSSAAEFVAAAYALRVAHGVGVTHARVHCDNKHVIRTLGESGYSLARKAAWPKEAEELLSDIGDIMIRAHWVKGHGPTGTAKSWVQSWCDTNAKRRMIARRAQFDSDCDDIQLIE